MMKIIDFYNAVNQEYWLEKIKESDWNAGQFLYELLKTHQLKEKTGEHTKVLLLTEEKELLSFCTLAEQDDIQPTPLTPWIGFVYTFPEYRGHHYAGMLLKHAEKLAANAGMKNIYISTNHVGLYEKYGYTFYQTMKDMGGEDSRVYTKKL